MNHESETLTLGHGVVRYDFWGSGMLPGVRPDEFDIFFHKLNRAFEKFFRSISAYDEELFGGSIVL